MRPESEQLKDETPPGGSPTPDEARVDEIGKAVGLTYNEEEPLRAGQKEMARDEHRWELDPASSEDYQERCNEAEPNADRVRHLGKKRR